MAVDSLEHETVLQVQERRPCGRRAFVRWGGRRAFVRWAGVLSAGLVAGACGPAQAPAPPTPAAAPTSPPAKPPAAPAPTVAPAGAPAAAAPTAAPAAPRKLIPTIVAGPNISFTWTALYLAKDKGFDKQNGIDLEIKHMTSDKIAMQGLIAGEVQVMEGNLSAFLTARASGVPIKVIGGNIVGAAMALGIRTDRGINRLADLYGKAIAISQPGALPDTLIRALFQKEGLDTEKLTYVAVGGNIDRARALLAGKVDAGIIHYSDVPLVLADPNIKLLVRISDAMPEYVSSGSGTSDSIADKQPDIPLGYVKTMIQGIRYLIANRDEAVAFGAKLLEAKPNDLASLYDQYLTMWAVNGHFPKEAVGYMQDLNIKSGTQDNPVSIDEAVTWEFTDKAVAALGKAGPPRRSP